MVAVAAFGLAWMHAHAGRLPIASAWTASVTGWGEGGWAPPLPPFSSHYSSSRPPPSSRSLCPPGEGGALTLPELASVPAGQTLSPSTESTPRQEEPRRRRLGRGDDLPQRCRFRTGISTSRQPRTSELAGIFHMRVHVLRFRRRADASPSLSLPITPRASRGLRPGLPVSGSQASRTGCPSVTDPR